MAPLAFEEVVAGAEVVPEAAGLLVVPVVTLGALIFQCQIKGYRAIE